MEIATPRIAYLAKLFEERQYAEDFVAGRLYMNTLGHFVKMEADPSMRADNREGTIAQWQPNQILIQIGDITIDSDSLAAPVTFQKPGLLNTHVLCMAAGLGIETDCYESFKDALLLPQRLLSMGKFAVLVTNGTNFSSKIKSALQRERLTARSRLVTYYDEVVHHGHIDDPLFAKPTRFRFQREYRLAIKNAPVGPGDPFVLDVGDLSDCVTLMAPEDLRKLEITRREGSPDCQHLGKNKDEQG